MYIVLDTNIWDYSESCDLLQDHTRLPLLSLNIPTLPAGIHAHTGFFHNERPLILPEGVNVACALEANARGFSTFRKLVGCNKKNNIYLTVIHIIPFFLLYSPMRKPMAPNFWRP